MFEFIEIPTPLPRPETEKINKHISFSVLKTMEEWNNAIIGLNPLTDITIIHVNKVVDLVTFQPSKHYLCFFKNGFFYAITDKLAQEINKLEYV